MYPEAGVLPQYSNFAYSVLGLIISQVAQKNGFKFKSKVIEENLAEYVREKILSPLNTIDNTDLIVPSRKTENDSTVYTGLHLSMEKKLGTNGHRFQV